MKNIFSIAMMLALAITSVSAQNTSGSCFRGFVDTGYGMGVGDFEFGRFEINTSHGYQFQSINENKQ